MTFRLRRRERAVLAEWAGILKILIENDSDVNEAQSEFLWAHELCGKPAKRNQSVFRRPGYAEMALEAILADARLVDPSFRFYQSYR